MASVVDIGNTVRVSGTFTDLLDSSAAFDPTEVHCSVRSPSGTVTNYEYGTDDELNKSTVGSYYIDVALTRTGYWYVRWWGVDADGVSVVANETTIQCTSHQAD